MRKNDNERHYGEIETADALCDNGLDGEYGDSYEDDGIYGTSSDDVIRDDSDYDDISDIMTEAAEREYDEVFGTGDKCRCVNEQDPTVPGIVYTPEGLPVYSGIYNNNGRIPDATLVHNDLCNAFLRIREAGIQTIEELKCTDSCGNDNNLFNLYGRALQNATRFMVATGKLRGLVLLQHKRSSVVDFDEVACYAVSHLIFRKSYFEVVKNDAYDVETTARIVMSFVERTVKDCAKFYKVNCPDVSEHNKDIANGKERKKYVAYPVSTEDPIGNGDNPGRRIDHIASPETEEDFKRIELLSCVEAYTGILRRNKVPKKQIDVFRIKAETFLRHGVYVTPADIAKQLGVSLQTVYSVIKKVDLLYADFAKYLAS